MRDHPATGAVVEPNGHAIGDSLRPERKLFVLLQEWLAAASGGETIAFGCRALPKVADSAEIAVCARLEQENLHFLNGRSITVLGDDVLGDANTPQFF